jgi:hypothetical protein
LGSFCSRCLLLFRWPAPRGGWGREVGGEGEHRARLASRGASLGGLCWGFAGGRLGMPLAHPPSSWPAIRLRSAFSAFCLLRCRPVQNGCCAAGLTGLENLVADEELRGRESRAKPELQSGLPFAHGWRGGLKCMKGQKAQKWQKGQKEQKGRSFSRVVDAERARFAMAASMTGPAAPAWVDCGPGHLFAFDAHIPPRS